MVTEWPGFPGSGLGRLTLVPHHMKLAAQGWQFRCKPFQALFFSRARKPYNILWPSGIIFRPFVGKKSFSRGNFSFHFLPFLSFPTNDFPLVQQTDANVGRRQLSHRSVILEIFWRLQKFKKVCKCMLRLGYVLNCHWGFGCSLDLPIISVW